MKSKVIMDGLDKMIPNPECPLNYKKDYELLLAVMLSAQTTDLQVNKVTSELFKFSIYELNEIDTKIIEDIIRPLGNMKKKSVYIKKIVKSLLDNYDGKVPNNREYLESLPGVGHKTTNVVLNVLFNEPTFAVDTHVYRVSYILGIRSKEDNIVTTETKLQLFFPKDSWGKLHHQLVLFGRYTCKSKNPNCEKCMFFNKCKNTKNDCKNVST